MVKIPHDPILHAIFRDRFKYTAFAVDLMLLKGDLVDYHKGVLHPTDLLLDTWYRFKEKTTPCLL